MHRGADHDHTPARLAFTRRETRTGDALHFRRHGTLPARGDVLTAMRFTDSHCHLTMSDATANLDRARSGGVSGFVVPATKLEDAPETIAIASAHDDVWAAVGF